MCVCVCVCVSVCLRERETHTHIQRETEAETETERQRETETETDRDTERHRAVPVRLCLNLSVRDLLKSQNRVLWPSLLFCAHNAVPTSTYVGTGLCTPLGIRVYEGNGDNPGPLQQQIDRCGAACFHQITALEYGPWSSRGDAVGFALTPNNGRCYCQHEDWGTCEIAHTTYDAYEFQLAGVFI